MKSLGVGVAAFGLSGALHAAAWLVPVGHHGQDRSASDRRINVDVTEVMPAPELPVPEPMVTPPADPARNGPSRQDPFPVPASHESVPRELDMAHPRAPAARAETGAPAKTAPALVVATDDTPRFTIAIGPGDDSYGAVSTRGAALSHEDASEPLPEPSVDVPARLLMGLAPSYPGAARAEGIEGDVRLELVVGVSGAVEGARVVRGVGRGLDEAALRAVRQFRFAPATKASHAVRVRMGWAMQFRLQ
jgi:protein TonB